MTLACTPLIACKFDRIERARHLARRHHEKRETPLPPPTAKAREAHLGKVGLDHQKRAEKPNGAGDHAVQADLFTHGKMTQNQHDKGHHKGNRQRIGQWQIAQCAEHQPDPEDMQHRADQRPIQSSRRQARGPGR